jgi:hypothetical protein
MRAKRHVADDGGGFGDEDIFAERRFFAEKCIKLLCQFVHANILTRSGGENQPQKSTKRAK